jgi:CofD-related protein of GAK system
VITAFDSGGSSRSVRQAFNMLAPGDLRNRLLALADRSIRGNPEVTRFLDKRLPPQAAPGELFSQLEELISGSHPWLRTLPGDFRHLVRAYLRSFAAACPAHFDLSSASIGNLVLTGCYLSHQRHLEPVLYLFSQLAAVRGRVHAVVEGSYHLVARYSDGTIRAGQHRITRGPDVPSMAVADFYLAEREDPAAPPVRVRTADQVLRAIAHADLIVYPMGSFYTSVIANLLPFGIGEAIRESSAPKVLIVNDRQDPESLALSPLQMVQEVCRYARRSDPQPGAAEDYVNFVLVNNRTPAWDRGEAAMRDLGPLGIEVLPFPLTRTTGSRTFHPQALCEILLSFC